jgi:hypothetical protein
MHRRREQRGGETKARHRVRWHRFELARHHRIGRPHEGRDKRRDQPGHLSRREPTAAVACKQKHRAGESEQCPDDVMRRQAFARQQRRKQHDQQRPEIIKQACFGRRREAQRQEIQGVVSEQPADPDDPCKRWLPQCADGIRPPDPCQRSHQRADRERHRGQLKCRNFPGSDRQHRQQRPHQDRGQADQRRGA